MTTNGDEIAKLVKKVTRLKQQNIEDEMRWEKALYDMSRDRFTFERLRQDVLDVIEHNRQLLHNYEHCGKYLDDVELIVEGDILTYNTVTGKLTKPLTCGCKTSFCTSKNH